jgi:hypothetical protein
LVYKQQVPCRCPCKKLHMSLDTEPDIKADIVTLTGNYVKEQKRWHILQFCKDTTANVPTINECDESDRPFNPQLLFATADAGNAGIDNRFIVGAGRAEIPPSCEDASQEKGRPGRYAGAVNDNCWYMCCMNLESYLSLCRRQERSKQKGLKLSVYLHMRQLLSNVLRIFVLPVRCIHAALAMDAANPYNPHPRQPLNKSCTDRCSFCLGLYKDIFPKVVRTGTVAVLMDVFLHQRQHNPVLIVDTSLVDAIRDYKSPNGVDSKELILSSKSKGKIRPIDVKKVILMLLSAGVLGLEPKFTPAQKQDDKEKDDKVEFHATLQHDEDRTLTLYDDSIWDIIPQK